uniref:Uncharacterized protein n=1 Tax=Arundo donax TaxID=35708 RepID=A0A0A9ERW2_ARUDO
MYVLSLKSSPQKKKAMKMSSLNKFKR